MSAGGFGRYGCPACPRRFEALADKKRHIRTEHKPSEPTAAAVCPECVNGKHRNCDGRAWDDVADELTACTCDHSGGDLG